MTPRGLLLAVLAPIVMAGCEAKKLPPVPPEDAYPVRADWLVVGPPAGVQPSKWYAPGYPPLFMLNRPFDTLAGDDALLIGPARSRGILNTRKVEPDLREEFVKVLAELFGTPADPKVPSADLLIVQLKLDEKLKGFKEALTARQADAAKTRAAAKDVRTVEAQIEGLRAVESDLKLDAATLKHGGLVYRNYCQQCHGLTGDGNGPGGRFLIPLPRDYRQGLFKFITTDPKKADEPGKVAQSPPPGPPLEGKRKPRRDDLRRTIVQGMPGSPMPQFSALNEADLLAVISYVIHLSIRGQAEYEVMKKAADPGADEMTREEIRKGVVEQSAALVSLWAQSGQTPIQAPANPYDTPEKILDSAASGFMLFSSPQVGCTTCHIGYGKSAPFQYDSWGSITRPRNLTVPILRGGRKPEEIYARIEGGILGSNMPAHTHLRPTQEDKEKGVNKIWDLVHFVLYISESDKRQLLKERKQIDVEP